MLHLSLAVALGLLCAPGDDSKKAIEDFKGFATVHRRFSMYAFLVEA